MEDDMDGLFEFEAELDEVESDDSKISWRRVTVEVWAESEEKAREQIADDMPEYTIHSIKQV